MKKFLIKILLFFISVVGVDILYGFACQYMNDHSKGGGTKSRHYTCKESNEEVLIFGSSRAKHHYVPDIIEDSLCLKCYNAGEDGNGIILSYGFLKIITERYSPKLIIYDVSGYDIYEDDNMKYLDLLKPYYREPGIDSIFWQVNSRTRLMMMSKLYCFNTSCLRIIGNYIHPMTNYPKGYYAIHKAMDYEPEVMVREKETVDTLKMAFIKKFIKKAQKQGISLVFCVSPTYKVEGDEQYYDPVKQLCEQYGIPLFFDSNDPEISSDKHYFQDRTHMNDAGARLYTSKLMHQIKLHSLL